MMLAGGLTEWANSTDQVSRALINSWWGPRHVCHLNHAFSMRWCLLALPCKTTVATRHFKTLKARATRKRSDS